LYKRQVRHGETGFLTPPGQPRELAKYIEILLSDDELRRRMGQAGREFIQTHFTFEAQAQAYLRLFAEMQIGTGAAGDVMRTAV